VRAIKDPENREAFQIEFVEVRSKPPMVMMSNPGVPEEINQMVVQVTKSFQGILPGTQETTYEQRKLTVILTGEEIESLNMKPYPNQLYELVISDKSLSFNPL
jgi:molybdopterin-biosynthesis enzyme MoeA-like protein